MLKPDWSHSPEEIEERFDRLTDQEAESLEKLLATPGRLRAPQNKSWIVKLPGGTHGFMLGFGETKVTILGVTPQGRPMGINYDIDITPYYFPDLQYPKPPSKTSSLLPGFDYDQAVHGLDLFLQ